MPRFYFHIRKGDHLDHDIEGADLPSLDYARDEALLAAREILAERVLNGLPIDGDVFEITAEDGSVLDRIPFKTAIIP